jgi:hypothetical protein
MPFGSETTTGVRERCKTLSRFSFIAYGSSVNRNRKQKLFVVPSVGMRSMVKLCLLPVVFTLAQASQPQIGQGNGVATYDGQGNVTFALTVNTNVNAGQAVKQTGTVSISSNCTGALSFPSETLNVAVYNQGRGFLFRERTIHPRIPATVSSSPPHALPPCCRVCTLSMPMGSISAAQLYRALPT